MAIKIDITELNSGERRNFCIKAESLDEAFKVLFRDYKNRYKYCNNISFAIDDEVVNSNLVKNVSLSSDGTIVAIGAIENNGNESGHVRVYENQGGVWIQIGSDIDDEVPINESELAMQFPYKDPDDPTNKEANMAMVDIFNENFALDIDT